MTSTRTNESTQIDLELIAQRILKLAEIATQEHMESLAGSQADALVQLVEQLKRAN